MSEPKKILIIEDDLEIRESLTEFLQSEHYEVSSAIHGIDAFKQLQAGSKPDLILLDLMMPIMDGFEFRAKQLESPEWSQIPVIIISADPSAASNQEFLKVDHYLIKPLEVERLLSLAAELTSR